MSGQGYVKIVHGALDLDDEGQEIILRGRLDLNSLETLLTDDYQREVLPTTTLQKILSGFSTGSIPDIDLGMRGQRVQETEAGVFLLKDPVFIIDGLQRVTAAKKYLAEGNNPRLGAIIHFGTTREWEIKRFHILNADRTKLSANVLLRNMKDDFEVVATLLLLSKDSDFVLGRRICWQQRMLRQHLISAVTFLKVVGALHSHIGPGKSNNVAELVPAIQKTMGVVGRNILRDNVRIFFEAVDECWDVRNIVYKEGAPYIRLSFMVCLAEIFSEHSTFWRDRRLFIEASWRKKLKLFPIGDPTVKQLASASGQARYMLKQLIIDHLNRGKRTRRLRKR